MAFKKALVTGDSPAVVAQIKDTDTLQVPALVAGTNGKVGWDTSALVFLRGAEGASSTLEIASNAFSGVASGALFQATATTGMFQLHASSSPSARLIGSHDGTLTWGGETIYHTGNDGSGSTLDADLLDGQHGSYYLTWTNMTGTLPVNKGGTGQTSLASARNAMGLGNTIAALPIANGGTSATNAINARANLGLGTAATYDVPASGNAASNQVVLGNDSRLINNNLPPGAHTEVIFNVYGVLTASSRMTFDGYLFKADEAQARLAEQILNANTTMNSTTVPNTNRVIKKTSTGNYTYTLATTLGANGDTLTFVNAASAGNITLQGSGVTLYVNGAVVSTLVIGPRKIHTFYRMASNQWIG